MKRKLFSILIALTLCLSLLPVPVMAEGSTMNKISTGCDATLVGVLDTGSGYQKDNAFVSLS